MRQTDLEMSACTPQKTKISEFNAEAQIPFGCTVQHVHKAMNDFNDFLGFINGQLYTKQMPRFESFLMPANFSSMVGEFIVARIPRYCGTLVKNLYHNGHPDLIPGGVYDGNACQHADQRIEVKASRHLRGWQGHNPEDVWLIVFVFDSNTARDQAQGKPPKPFRFLKVIGAQLTKADWSFSGRSKTSRRTITASVTRSGFEKMENNWIYRSSLIH